MSIFDEHGCWLFGNDGTMDEKLQEKEHQEELCRLMEMYQAYQGVIKERTYVLRGSKIACEYGTNTVLLDMHEDHGVTWWRSMFPVATCLDCTPYNINCFGSCLCPEKKYAGRLPMTRGIFGNGAEAIKVGGNIFAHICIPLIREGQEWKQIEEDVLIEVGQEGFAPMLLDDAVLVCQYGGIIRILEAPETKAMEDEDVCSDYGIDYELNDDEKLFIAVIAAESIGEGELAWKVVANVIMNRVGSAEWSNYVTPREVIEKKNAFSCLLNGGSKEYKKAVEYLENRVDDDGIYEQLIAVVMPIYYGEELDVTGGAQLYYSPKSMSPPGSEPWWASYYKQITVEGIDPNDFVLFTGERIK